MSANIEIDYKYTEDPSPKGRRTQVTSMNKFVLTTYSLALSRLHCLTDTATHVNKYIHKYADKCSITPDYIHHSSLIDSEI